jgi:hypothetical protein
LSVQTPFKQADLPAIESPDWHMLHFLSSLFKPAAGKAGAADKAPIEAASERAIDATDEGELGVGVESA